MRYSVSAALHHLTAGSAPARAPARGPRYQFNGAHLAKDEHRNTLGGIRLPPVDVPVARYESEACDLGGITVPFTDAQIHGLYPTFDRYQRLMRRATNRVVRAGLLFPPTRAT